MIRIPIPMVYMCTNWELAVIIDTMSTGYIPRGNAEFDSWFANLKDYVVQKTTSIPPEWEHIPAKDVEELAAAYDDWHQGYAPTLQPHTPAQTVAKNDARERAETVVRPFVQRFLHFKPVTDVDRVEMGIPNHDKTRTGHTVVHETVDFVIHVRNQRELSIDFWQEGQAHKAKPDEYDGAVMVWEVLNAPPADQDALRHHTLASRTPVTLRFTEEDRGKRCYVALRWQNERGIVGAWSDMKEAVIP